MISNATEDSTGAAGDESEVFAEAEGADTLLERGAVTASEALEKSLEFERAGDILLDFGELSGGQFFPAWANRGIVAEATEEEFDFAKGEAHLASEADEQDAMEGVARIAALAARALGRGEEA